MAWIAWPPDLTASQKDHWLRGWTTQAAHLSPAEVPGPLPLFGAAAAFGYSRRLRRRVSLSRVVPNPADSLSV
jgi:hypothetical protein